MTTYQCRDCRAWKTLRDMGVDSRSAAYVLFRCVACNNARCRARYARRRYAAITARYRALHVNSARSEWVAS